MNSSVNRIFLHITFPLLVGFFIYFFFRPDVAFVQWLGKRDPIVPLNSLNKFSRWLVYSGPDFCWSYSLSSVLFVWESWQGKKIRWFPVMVLFIIIGSEAIQLLLSSYFTADWSDVIAALLAFLLSWLVIERNYEKR